MTTPDADRGWGRGSASKGSNSCSAGTVDVRALNKKGIGVEGSDTGRVVLSRMDENPEMLLAGVCSATGR